MPAGWRSAWVRSCICYTSFPEIPPAGPDPLLMPVMPAQFYQENEDRAQ